MSELCSKERKSLERIPTKMYIIGLFLDTNEVEVVPEEWLANPSTSVKSTTQCWWPPYKSTAKAVSSREEVDTRTWKEYSLKILGRYETIDEARKKLPKATETSNIDSDDEIQLRRKRKKTKFLIEDEQLTSEDELNEKTILPMPPKYSKKQSNQERATPAAKKTPKSVCQDHSLSRNINQGSPSSRNVSQECSTPRSTRDSHLDYSSPNITIRNQECSSPHSSSNMMISHQDFSSLRTTGCSSTQNITFKEQNQDLQSRSDPLMLLRRDVLDIKFKLNTLIESFDDLKDKVLNSVHSITGVTEQNAEEFEEIISITNKFPMSEEDLETVEIILENAKIKNNLISYLKKYGGNNVKAATFTLLRMMISDYTGSKFSWVGGKKKKVFSSLRVFEAMSDAIRARFVESTIQEISTHVKTWLRNAPMRILLKQKKNNGLL